MSNDLLRVAADDGRERSAHPDVRLEGGSSAEESVVRGRNVGVGTEDGRYPAVEMERKRGLLGRRLHVRIDEDALHPGICGKEFIGGLKRIVRGKSHKDPPEDIEDQEFPPAGICGQRKPKTPLSGRITGEVRRTTHRFARILEQWNDPSIAVDVISEGDAIHPEISNRAIEIRGQSRTIPKVLGIRNDQIRGVITPHFGDSGRQYASARSAVEIAEKGDSGRSGRAGACAFTRIVPRLAIHEGITVHSNGRE